MKSVENWIQSPVYLLNCSVWLNPKGCVSAETLIPNSNDLNFRAKNQIFAISVICIRKWRIVFVLLLRKAEL